MVHRMFFHGRYYVSGILCTQKRKRTFSPKKTMFSPALKKILLFGLSAPMT